MLAVIDTDSISCLSFDSCQMTTHCSHRQVMLPASDRCGCQDSYRGLVGFLSDASSGTFLDHVQQSTLFTLVARARRFFPPGAAAEIYTLLRPLLVAGDPMAASTQVSGGGQPGCLGGCWLEPCWGMLFMGVRPNGASMAYGMVSSARVFYLYQMQITERENWWISVDGCSRCHAVRALATGGEGGTGLCPHRLQAMPGPVCWPGDRHDHPCRKSRICWCFL